MENKNCTFVTYSREELVALVRDMATALSPQIVGSTKPLVIHINGELCAGKSLFWDEMTDTILGTSAKQKRSLLPADFLTRMLTGHRAYERWQGTDAKSGLKTTFLFANPRIYGLAHQRRIESLYHCLSKKNPGTATADKLANAVIINNALFREKDAPALSITLSSLRNSLLSDWHRTTVLAVKHPALQQSEQFNAFLERHAA